jgi:hypothetical protein
MPKVIHQGGPRHGQVDDLEADALRGALVYDGPRWLGVYRPADPPRVFRTASGDAQVWVVVE